ncbi:TPA: hypothetical protein U2Q41_002948 [Citrobacter koseri]|nr:hypothetical protein [Citrobacter koseri]HEM8572973.1 hypothetical protein [Citrobacter koseri]
MANSYQNIPVPTPTQNPVPSADIRDHVFAGSKLDEVVTSLAIQYIDRFGKAHYTIEGLKKLVLQQIYNLGFNPVGTFQDGATLVSAGDIIQDETTGAWYRWDDLTTLPKTVPSGSTPDSTGGTGVGKWLAVDVSDVLRRELALPTGAELSGYGDVTVAERLSYDVYFTGDSTSTVDAIQDFIDDNAGCTIHFPPGDFNITDWLFVPANTKIKGAQEIGIKSHSIRHPEYVSILNTMFSSPGITRFNLTGTPNKHVVTDVVEATADSAISAGISLCDENSGLKDVLITGWRRRTDGTFERPMTDGVPDAGATPCFDIGIFIPAISGCSVEGVAVIGYFGSGYAAMYLDASRSYLNNGSGNTFNINDRFKSNSMCDLTVQNDFFWPMDYNTPTQTTGPVSAYGIKLKGTDRDVRDLSKYPTVNGAASNWIWGGHGTSDQFYINTVARGISFDAALRTFNGDTRLSDTTTGVNGYPLEGMAGRGSKIFFTNCTFRLGDIYLNRVTNFNMVNCYGEAGVFTQTNLTGRVTVFGGDILQGYQSVTLPNVDGSTPSVPYDLNTSPMFFSYGSGKNDRFQLFHTSPSNAYFRPHFDNKIANGYYDGTTRWAWSDTYTVQLTTAGITCFGTANSVKFIKPPRLPSFTTALRPSLNAADAGSMILDTTLGYQITWTGSAWKDGVGNIV